MLVDFHSHSTLSDGTLAIEEMVAIAELRGYDAYAITDHARGEDSAYLDVVAEVRDRVDRLRSETRLRLFAGVELTDFEPALIAEVATRVRRAGAQVVVVHGECLSLHVAPGTNSAAVRAPAVDILAHPGLLTEKDADEAARHDIFVEISGRHGADWSNGHVLHTATKAGASLVVDSDAHTATELLTSDRVRALLRGAGASDLMVRHITTQMAPALVEKVVRRTAEQSRVAIPTG